MAFRAKLIEMIETHVESLKSTKYVITDTMQANFVSFVNGFFKHHTNFNAVEFKLSSNILFAQMDNIRVIIAADETKEYYIPGSDRSVSMREPVEAFILIGDHMCYDSVLMRTFFSNTTAAAVSDTPYTPIQNALTAPSAQNTPSAPPAPAPASTTATNVFSQAPAPVSTTATNVFFSQAPAPVSTTATNVFSQPPTPVSTAATNVFSQPPVADKSATSFFSKPPAADKPVSSFFSQPPAPASTTATNVFSQTPAADKPASSFFSQPPASTSIFSQNATSSFSGLSKPASSLTFGSMSRTSSLN